MGNSRQQPAPFVRFTQGENYEKRIARLLELCSENMLRDGLDKAVKAEDYEAAILFRDEIDKREKQLYGQPI
jgi:protein-arginine kinase activator protein McsA